MTILKYLFVVAGTLVAATTSARSQDASPADVAKIFTREVMSGCLKQFDAQGMKPIQQMDTKPVQPEEEATFEAMGIKCSRVVINPDPREVVAPGSKEKPAPSGGCRFLLLEKYLMVTVSGRSARDLRAGILYPKHNFTLDLDEGTVRARTDFAIKEPLPVPLVPDFEQLVRTTDAAIRACFEQAR